MKEFKSNARETWHPRGAFILVGDCTPNKTNLLLAYRSGSLLRLR